MRFKLKTAVLFILIVFFALPSAAQYLVVGAEQVQDMMTGKKKAVLIDVRTPVEYNEGHIPGAVNIPAERIVPEKARLPKDKSTALIFYCRGAG